MEKITTKGDFEAAIDFVRSRNYHDDFKDTKAPFKNIPEIIRKDKAILPRHLHFSLFKELLIEELLNRNQDYQIDNNSGSIIDQVSQYSTMDEKFLINESFSFTKGLLIMGKVGCGKTQIINALAALLRRFLRLSSSCGYRSDNLDVNYFPAYTLTERFIKSGYEIFDGVPSDSFISPNTPKIRGELLFIDDIGSENIVSSFGNTANVIGELILRRYDLKRKLFATTNMDPKSLKAFYGDRVYSRMTEMMNFCVMEGEDRRI